MKRKTRPTNLSIESALRPRCLCLTIQPQSRFRIAIQRVSNDGSQSLGFKIPSCWSHTRSYDAEEEVI